MATSNPRTSITPRAKSRPKREAMSRVDTAWLRMERPTNPMMITGVLMLEQRLSIEALRTLIAERFLAFKRFRQKAVDTGAACHWETDADFDIEWHVRLTALPGAAGKPELQRLADQYIPDWTKLDWAEL